MKSLSWNPEVFGPRFHVIGGISFCLGLLCGCPSTSTPLVSQQPGTRSGGQITGGCSVHEVARERLIVEGGRQMYVEPTVLEPSRDGDVLLAGTYNYLFEQVASGGWKAAGWDSLFGAVVPRSGAARIVRSPVPSRLLGGVRAVAGMGGTWDVVFAEVKPWTGQTRSDTVARLWHGVLQGARWKMLEPLPLPPEGTITSMLEASSLVRRGDMLAWAVKLDRPGKVPSILVYERIGKQWSYDQIPTFHSFVDLAYTDHLGLVLAVTQADPRLRNDSNSLLLWARAPDWKIVRTVVQGSREKASHPRITATPGVSILTWEAEVTGGNGEQREAHVLVGDLADSIGSIVTLDSSIVPTYPVNTLTLTGRPHLWITDHLLSGDYRRDIHVVRESGGAVSTLGSFLNPYFTPFTAAVLPSTQILLTGGLLDRAQQVGVTMLLRLRVQCSSRAP